MKQISQFRFKRFAVWHHRSAMKVGVDGVLIGCWTDVAGCRTILDVGTGCGLIALMMAQRRPDANVIAIDIDVPSCEEAKENAAASPWSGRVNVVCGRFPDDLALYIPKEEFGKFDLIVSNPPYFDAGIHDIVTPRERARHQGELSPYSLLASSKSLLNIGGSVAMVVPSEYSVRIESYALMLGYKLSGKCLVRGHKDAPFKRVLLQWRLPSDGYQNVATSEAELTLEIEPGVPTDEYRSLCKDFYIKF